MKRAIITRYFIQHGSSQDTRVSDNDAWYVIRQTWADAGSAMSRCEIETKCTDRAEAVGLAELYNAPPEPLVTLAEWSGIGYSALIAAAKSEPSRLHAWRVGKRWMSTRRDVVEYQARMSPKPRRKI